MRRSDAGHEVGFLAGDEFQSIDAVARLRDLPDGRVHPTLVRRSERERDLLELCGRDELEVAISGGPSLQLERPLGPRARPAEDPERQDAERDEKRRERSERDEELRLDRDRNPRERADDGAQRPYRFSSVRSCRMNAGSDPWAMICCGVLLMSFTSPSRSAKKRRVSSGSYSRQS